MKRVSEGEHGGMERKREVEGVRREIKRGRRADKKRGTGWSGVENRGKRVALEGERGVREREREERLQRNCVAEKFSPGER